ncbi:MAG: type II toxin-antitoxin system VapC family toxin [Xanthomonadales bacterium]|nr:type II toxin-antitoxin system VapC family toxin [Xanthomonadales bacterium]
MHSVDTTVLVRYVTNDDPEQSPVARRFLDSHQVRASWSVLLESAWVLRSAHKLTRQRIAYIMRQLAGLPSISVDDPERFARVVGWFEAGMGFADAMHLAGCEDGETLATFDRKLKTTAGKIKAGKVELLCK